ncbi:MAG: FHA domain-containing protein [Xanthomonadales bacterium]|jgi:hypothetical protein|nr:FHA domain-containing protein [Xanthomonadales bacterium]
MRIARLYTFCLSLLLVVPCAAQTVDSTEDAFAVSQGAAVPPYVVPVLRLVSKTHVEPTTGIVLSDSGLVLVPEGFASAGDEIVVLDGGTDIVANGRTASIEANFPMDGLQVLNVYGLRRNAAPFADSELEDGDEVRLTAFPPAEQIAEGAEPLDIMTTVTVFGESRNPAVSGETPLPNVTGPLLDECGNVAAFSIARDVQSMETSPGTRYQWRTTLLGVIERLGIRPGPSACIEAVPAAEVLPEEEPVLPVEEEVIPAPVVEEPQPAPADEETEEETIEEPEPEFQEALEVDILPPIETIEEPLEEQAPEEEPASGWLWLLFAALLIAAGFGLHRWRQALGRQVDEENAAPPPLPPGDPEEDVAVFQQPPMDSLLVLNGRMGDGSEFEVSCPVSSQAVNVVIGRGTTDLQIQSPAVSRQHAALNGTAGALTVTDLGSNNGTSINGVPCLEGEIMYVETGDTLMLGDTRFTVELRPAAGDNSG